MAHVSSPLSLLVYCSNYKCSPRSCAAFGLQDRLLCRQRSICQYFRAGLESTSMKPCRQRWAIIFFSKFPPILFLVIVRRMYAGDFSKPWHPHAPGAGVLFGRSALSPETRLPAALLCTDRRNHRPCKSVRKKSPWRKCAHQMCWAAGLFCGLSSDRVTISGDGSADHVRLSGLELRFTCLACGNLGADIRPGFNCDKPDALTSGF